MQRIKCRNTVLHFRDDAGHGRIPSALTMGNINGATVVSLAVLGRTHVREIRTIHATAKFTIGLMPANYTGNHRDLPATSPDAP